MRNGRSVKIGLEDSSVGSHIFSRRRDDAVHGLVVRICWDLLDQLFIETNPDKRHGRVELKALFDPSIIEPRAASEPMTGGIESETWDQREGDLGVWDRFAVGGG